MAFGGLWEGFWRDFDLIFYGFELDLRVHFGNFEDCLLFVSF